MWKLRITLSVAIQRRHMCRIHTELLYSHLNSDMIQISHDPTVISYHENRTNNPSGVDFDNYFSQRLFYAANFLISIYHPASFHPLDSTKVHYVQHFSTLQKTRRNTVTLLQQTKMLTGWRVELGGNYIRNDILSHFQISNSLRPRYHISVCL